MFVDWHWTKNFRRLGLLRQGCWRRLRQQGGGVTGSWCGVETRSLSRCLPRLCGRSSTRLSVQGCYGRHIAHPGCTEKKGSRRDRSAAGEHVTPHGLACSVVCLYVLCFHFEQKGPSRLLAVVHWQSPHTGHMTKGGGGAFHWSKLWYQRPLWTPVMICRPGKEQQDPPIENIYTTTEMVPCRGWCFHNS